MALLVALASAQAAVPEITVVAQPAIEPTAPGAVPPRLPGSFTFTRNPVEQRPLRVRFTIGGTASRGRDYILTRNTVTFRSGQATATVPFRVRDDNEVELFETVVVTISEGPGYTIGAENSATAAITDDDVLVTVEATTPLTSEPGGSESPGVFTITRTAPSEMYPLSKSLTVPFSVVGTANRKLDYVQLPKSVTFEPGASTATVTVYPIADQRIEDDETVYIALLPRTGYSLGIPFTATVTILDAEPVGPVLLATRWGNGVVSFEFDQPMHSDYSFGWMADVMIPQTNFRRHRWSWDRKTFMFDASIPSQTSVTFILNPSSHQGGFRNTAGQLLDSDTPSAEISN